MLFELVPAHRVNLARNSVAELIAQSVVVLDSVIARWAVSLSRLAE